MTDFQVKYILNHENKKYLSTFLHENKIFTRPNMHENKIFKPSPHIRKCTIYQITTKNHWLLPLL